MADIKFSGDERETVIERLETLKNIKLKPVRRYKKFLKGSDGLYYCIVGGSGDWHAIPKEVMEQEKKGQASVYLVIARWLKKNRDLRWLAEAVVRIAKFVITKRKGRFSV